MNKIELKDVGKRIAVVSGKGGTGKSTFSALLALSLAEKGKKVGLLDIDVHGPNIPLMLGIEGKKLGTGGNKRLLPVKAVPNLKVVSTSFMLGEEQALIWRGPLKSNFIRQIVEQTDWGKLDFLVIDTPPGTGDEIITLTQLIDLTGSIIVGTPQTAAVYDVRKSIDAMRAAEVKILGLIENMSYTMCPKCGEKLDLFGEGRIKKLAEKEKIGFFGSMPLDPKLRKMADEGKIELKDIERKITDLLTKVIESME